MKRIRTVAAMLAVMSMAGCQAYERQPLEIQEYAERWRQADLSAASSVASRTDDEAAPFDVSDGLSLPEARAIALTFNPDLRVERLRAQVPLAGSRHAGLLDDPEFGFDVSRIVESVDDPWIAGVGIGFTIPLSGRLAVAKDQAWADYTAAWRSVAVREAELVTEVDRAWARWRSATRQRAMIEAHLAQLEPLESIVTKLRDAGELRPIDARRVEMAIADGRGRLIVAAGAADRERGRLLELLGLVPDAPVAFNSEDPMAAPPETADVGRAILAHPRLELARAHYEVAELHLRREITKQYPDLTIGPTFKDDEGQSQIGLSGAIPVPLFNRNQRGIAEAAANRDAARAEAEREYQRLTAAVAGANHELAVARRKRQGLEQAAAIVNAQIEDVRRLIEIGEIDVLALTDAMERAIRVRSALAQTEAEIGVHAADLRSILDPTWVVVPATREDEVHP